MATPSASCGSPDVEAALAEFPRTVRDLRRALVGKRGEDFEAAFAADMAELRKLNR
jgi:hypothetical protein